MLWKWEFLHMEGFEKTPWIHDGVYLRWCLGMHNDVFTLSLWSFTIKHNNCFNGTVGGGNVREIDCVLCACSLRTRGPRGTCWLSRWNLVCWLSGSDALGVWGAHPAMPSDLHFMWLLSSPCACPAWRADSVKTGPSSSLSPDTSKWSNKHNF